MVEFWVEQVMLWGREGDVLACAQSSGVRGSCFGDESAWPKASVLGPRSMCLDQGCLSHNRFDIIIMLCFEGLRFSCMANAKCSIHPFRVFVFV